MLDPMMPIRLSSMCAAILAVAAPLRPAEEVIEMFQSSFLPPSVTIELGGTVTWQWVRGIHTVTSGLPDGASGTPDEPDVTGKRPPCRAGVREPGTTGIAGNSFPEQPE